MGPGQRRAGSRGGRWEPQSAPCLLCDLGRVTETWSSVSRVGTPSRSTEPRGGGWEMVKGPRGLVHSRLCRKISEVKLRLL